jgi:hypothetical protein
MLVPPGLRVKLADRRDTAQPLWQLMRHLAARRPRGFEQKATRGNKR